MNLLKINLLIGVLLLIGCTSFQPKPVFKYIPWQKRYVKLQQNKQWTIYGSFSVTHNKRRDIARFEWINNKSNYAVTVSGPMNLNKVKIVGYPNKIKFCQSTSKCVYAKSPEQLFFNEFGWQLPMSNIQHWILTLPVPNKAKKTKLDQYGHLIKLEQDGWKIDYSEFQPIKNIDLPKVIEIKNTDFTIKLKVNKILF